MRIISQLLPRRFRDRLRRILSILSIQRRYRTKRRIGVLSQWTIVTRGLHSDAVIYSGGVGEDITFEQELIRRFGVKIHIFDPSLQSLHVRSASGE